ncbi:MAG: hypothetical protein PVJ21_23315 [Anaerolineales bacterium]|jgi:hypothetical protein
MKSKKRTRLLIGGKLILVVLLISLLASCNITINLPDDTQPGSQQSNSSSNSPGNTSGNSQPSSSGVHIDFWADDTNLSTGDCTMLHWNTSGGTAYINGNEHPSSGEYEICPDKSTKYKLELENPPNNLLGEEEFTVDVSQAGNNNAPASSSNSSNSSSGSQSQQSSNEPFSADLAVTDIYPGKQPYGQFHVRITNNGPGTLNKVKVGVSCSSDRTDLKTGKVSFGGKVDFDLNMGIKPGETQAFPTGLELDTNVYEYLVGCEIQPTFKDPDPGNNEHSEPLAGNPDIQGVFITTTEADLEPTDLYPDNMPIGKIFVRITNHGPNALVNTTVTLNCEALRDVKPGMAATGDRLVEERFDISVTLKPGQTEAYDTRLENDTEFFEYEVTCGITGVGFEDPDSHNNVYQEDIP